MTALTLLPECRVLRLRLLLAGLVRRRPDGLAPAAPGDAVASRPDHSPARSGEGVPAGKAARGASPVQPPNASSSRALSSAGSKSPAATRNS